MQRKIMWISQHLEFDPRTGRVVSEFKDVPPPEPDELEGEEEEFPNVQDIISTPFGLWRLDDSMNPFRQFKLWMAHCNFTIGPRAMHIIKNVPGVEVLYVLTRYRFIIGVGELFNIRGVRIAIEKALCGKHASTSEIEIFGEDVQDQVKKIKSRLMEKYDKWAIYVFPHGKVDYITLNDNDPDKYNTKLAMYKEAEKISHGVLIESD